MVMDVLFLEEFQSLRLRLWSNDQKFLKILSLLKFEKTAQMSTERSFNDCS